MMCVSKKMSKQKELTQKVLCSLLAAGVLSVGLPMGSALAAEKTVDYGDITAEGGRRVIYVTLPEDVSVTNDDTIGVTTLQSASLTIDYDGSQGDVGAIQARAEKKMDIYPVLNVLTEDSLTVNSAYVAAAGQDGIVNLNSSNGDVVLSTSYTSDVALGAGKTTAEHLSNQAYSAIYARNLFGAGEVNVSGKNVQILTAEQTMTGTGMENVKYGTAISGNGSGEVNIHAADEVVIHGAIESLNTLMQSKGTTGIKINVNQDAADTAKVTMEGLFINAADQSEVNIKGGAGSSIKVFDKIIASASDKVSGGKINIDFADGGTIEGDLVAKNGGVIDLGGTITFDGAKTSFTATDNGTINLVSGVMDGSLNIAAGSSVGLTGATFKANDLEKAITGGKLVVDQKGILETVAGQVFSIGDTKATDLAGNAVKDNVKTNVDFDGGTLKLTDAEYTLGYVGSAKDALTAGYEGSKTGIVMTGNLVAEAGEVIDKVTVDQAASVGSDVALDKVTVTDAGTNLLIGAEVSQNTSVDGVAIDSTDTTSTKNGFNAAGLDLGTDSTGAIITNGQAVTLGGSQGGNLVTVAGQTTEVTLVVGTDSTIGDAQSTSGTLNIGNAITDASVVNTITGSITINQDSDLNVKGTTTVTKGVELAGGTVNVGDGLLKADITAAKGTSTVTGAAQVGTLTAAAGATLNLGAEDKAAKVVVENLDLKGGKLFLNPIWKDGAPQDQGTEVAIAGADVNGQIIVGQNSTLSLGTDDTAKAQAAFAKTGLSWSDSDTLAAVYVAAPITLNSAGGTEGGLYVDPNAANDAVVDNNTITFNNGSVLMVDGAAVTATAAISGVTTSTIDAGSKLYIDGAKKNETYKILACADEGWADANIISDNRLLTFTGDTATDSKFDVTASLQKVNNVFNNQVVIGNVVDASLAGDKADAAQKFFENAVNSKYNATDAAMVNALNSAANMGELAGVSHGTYSMSNIMTDAVSKHLSLANHAEADNDIWAHYVHNKEEIRDMDMGGMQGSYDMKYNGIVVGGDFYNKGKATAGVALSYAKGDVNSVGNSISTKNDAEYYGLSLYGRVNNGNSSVTGDISYLHGKNDITQNNSGTKITASPKSDAFSMGVRAEKAYTVGAGKLVPFAGLRYLHLGVGDYSNSLGMQYNADDQNLWLLPIGVTYSHDIKAGDWTVRPLLEAGYVWTAGDRDTDQTVSLNGVSDGFGFNVADSGSFVGRFALEAEKANVTFGLGYEYQKGDTVKADRLMANVRFSF